MLWQRDQFWVSDQPQDLDIAVIHQFLKDAYWCKDIPRKTVEQALQGSLCMSLHNHTAMLGFCRAITDRATFAYIGDVFILPEFRGSGLGKWLVECLLAHPELQDLRRWLLATRDAHGLYAGYGFTPLQKPEMFMEKHNPNIYSLDSG